MVKVIGLTGGTGSGKGVISAYLKSLGAQIIDADAIAHEVYKKGKPAYTEIVQYFGLEILDEQKEIKRPALGNIVFSDNEKLAFLNNCTHHYIYEEIKLQIAYCKSADCKSANCKSANCKLDGVIVLDAPLFDETLQQLCDEVWLVFAAREVRVERIVQRDHITIEQAENRVNSQNDFDDYKKFSYHILDNSGDFSYLSEQIDKLLLRDSTDGSMDFRKNSVERNFNVKIKRI